MNAKVLNSLRLPWQSCPSNEFSDEFAEKPATLSLDGRWITEENSTRRAPARRWVRELLARIASLLDWDLAGFAAPRTANGTARPLPPILACSAAGVYSATLKDVTDGASTTFMLGERRAELLWYGRAFSVNFPGTPTTMKLNSKLLNPDNMDDWGHNWGFGSQHEAGANFLLVDGKVRFINDAVDYKIYCYLGDKADGNKVGEF